jgi:uncharacterized protein YecA (UPF0149 family)
MISPTYDRYMLVLRGLVSPRRRQKPVRAQHVGRNEKCPCGSGTKFKRCCGR